LTNSKKIKKGINKVIFVIVVYVCNIVKCSCEICKIICLESILQSMNYMLIYIYMNTLLLF